MSVSRPYCSAAARAIWEHDQCSFGAPETGQDGLDWDKARGLFYGILERNGYQLAEPDSKRIKKRAEGRP